MVKPRSALPSVLPAVLAACLLQACAGKPLRNDWAMQPLLRVDDAGADPAALYQAGRSFQQNGQPALAAQAYARSIELAPRQLDARNALAVLQAGQGQLDQAAALLRALLADFPDQAQPHSNLGYVYYLKGETAAAEVELRRALALDPGHARARANLALLGRQPAQAQAGTPPAAAAAQVPAGAGTAVRAEQPAATQPQARMEVVQIAPHQLRLQAKMLAQAAPPAKTHGATPGSDPSRQTPAVALGLLAETPAVAAGLPTERAAGFATQQAAPTVTAPATGALPAARIQLINGNGNAAMGEQLRATLAQAGIASGRVLPQRRFHQRQSVIEYLPGHEAQARRMQAALQGAFQPPLLLAARRLPGQTAIRLVLGRDQLGATARLATLPPPAVPVQAQAPASTPAALYAVTDFNQE